MKLLLIPALGLGLIVGYMIMFEDQYIYFPMRDLARTPADTGLAFEERYFHTEDGLRLHGWHIPSEENALTVLHFHGNAGNISHRLHLYRRWHDMGLAVFSFDYRGYGKSEGEPSEAGLYEDGRSAWRELQDVLNIPAQRIILAGRSIGCAVAAQLATTTHAAGLALETPFTNIPDMAKEHYPWLPLGPFIRSRFDTLRAIAGVDAPLLLIHANDDHIAPAWMAERILDAANAPKNSVGLSGGHNDFDMLAERAYISAWTDWLRSL
ncbi:MAG: alpha/beta hydrolase [Mariprofundaceae bacterium]